MTNNLFKKNGNMKDLRDIKTNSVSETCSNSYFNKPIDYINYFRQLGNLNLIWIFNCVKELMVILLYEVMALY